jgi:hypothetical protein
MSFDLLLLFVPFCVLERILYSDHLSRCLVYAARLTQDDTNRSKKSGLYEQKDVYLLSVVRNRPVLPRSVEEARHQIKVGS